MWLIILMTDEEIGPWLSDTSAAAGSHRTTKREYKGQLRSRLMSSQGRRPTKASHKANISPVSLQTPYFSVFTPSANAQTRKPLRAICKETFGLFTQRVPKARSTLLSTEFDIGDAKKALLRLSRTPKRTVGVGPEQQATLVSSGSLLSESGAVTLVADILTKPSLRVISDPGSQSDYSAQPPSRYYRRRVKCQVRPVLSFNDYDNIAENFNEQLAGLITRKPKTAATRRKTPAKTKGDFGSVLVGMVCGAQV